MSAVFVLVAARRASSSWTVGPHASMAVTTARHPASIRMWYAPGYDRSAKMEHAKMGAKVEPAPPAGYVWADGLDSYDSAPNSIQSKALKVDRAKLEAQADAVVSAAKVFGSDKTTAYAKSWTRRLLKTGTADPGEGEFALCEECLENPYSEDCVRLEEAIKAMQRMVGVDWGGTAA